MYAEIGNCWSYLNLIPCADKSRGRFFEANKRLGLTGSVSLEIELLTLRQGD